MKLKEWRWLEAIYQEELANKLGMSQAYISKIETGESKPNIEFRKKFKEVYGEKEFKKIEELELNLEG